MDYVQFGFWNFVEYIYVNSQILPSKRKKNCYINLFIKIFYGNIKNVWQFNVKRKFPVVIQA